MRARSGRRMAWISSPGVYASAWTLNVQYDPRIHVMNSFDVQIVFSQRRYPSLLEAICISDEILSQEWEINK